MYDFLNDEQWFLHSKQIEAAFKKIERTCGRAVYFPPIHLEAVQAIKLPHVIVHDQIDDYSTAKPVYVIVSVMMQTIWIRIESK